MADILNTILIGILLIVLTFLALHKLLRIGGKVSAVAVAMLTVAIYIPMVIYNWPGADVFAMHIALYLVTAYLLGIITSYREARLAEAGPGEKTGWFHWGPAVIIVFFVIIIALDSIFVTMATKGVESDVARWLLPAPRSGSSVVESHFPGTVENDYQKIQLEYNRYLDRLAMQKKRGWQIREGWLTNPFAGESMTYQLEVKDKQGKPVTGGEVVGRFLRPSNSKDDVDFTMHEVAPGRYQTPMQLNLPGHWDMVVYVRVGDDMHEHKANTYIENRR